MIKEMKNEAQSVIEYLRGRPGLSLWLSILLALILLGGFSLLASLVTSMEILEFSLKISWAGLIATYIFLVTSGSGLCIINALGSVFGMRGYEMMTRRVVFLSIITIVFGMFCILIHLGRPERLPIYNLLSPNFRSAISWMGMLYTIYLAVVAVEFWLLNRKWLIEKAERAGYKGKAILNILALKKLDDTFMGKIFNNHELLRILGALAFISGASALSMLGSVFAHVESRVMWYGPYYPVYFLVSAIFCGYTFLMATTIITYRVRREAILPVLKIQIFEMAKVLVIILIAGFFMIFYRLFTAFYDPLLRDSVILLINGPFSFAFWFFEVGLMIAAPVFVLTWAAWSKNINGVLVGSLSVLIGGYVMRYVFVVAGQVYPNIPEGLPTYFPTLMEILLISGVLGILLLVYTFGEILLDLKETQPDHTN